MRGERLVPRWLPQVEGEMQCSGKFPLQRYQGLSPARLPRYTKRWQRRQKLQWHRICSDVGLTWTCKQANNFAPNEYRGVVNSSGLVVYKGSNARDKKY